MKSNEFYLAIDRLQRQVGELTAQLNALSVHAPNYVAQKQVRIGTTYDNGSYPVSGSVFPFRFFAGSFVEASGGAGTFTARDNSYVRFVYNLAGHIIPVGTTIGTWAEGEQWFTSWSPTSNLQQRVARIVTASSEAVGTPASPFSSCVWGGSLQAISVSDPCNIAADEIDIWIVKCGEGDLLHDYTYDVVKLLDSYAPPSLSARPLYFVSMEESGRVKVTHQDPKYNYLKDKFVDNDKTYVVNQHIEVELQQVDSAGEQKLKVFLPTACKGVYANTSLPVHWDIVGGDLLLFVPVDGAWGYNKVVTTSSILPPSDPCEVAATWQDAATGGGGLCDGLVFTSDADPDCEYLQEKMEDLVLSEPATSIICNVVATENHNLRYFIDYTCFGTNAGTDLPVFAEQIAGVLSLFIPISGHQVGRVLTATSSVGPCVVPCQWEDLPETEFDCEGAAGTSYIAVFAEEVSPRRWKLFIPVSGTPTEDAPLVYAGGGLDGCYASLKWGETTECP